MPHLHYSLSTHQAGTPGSYKAAHCWNSYKQKDLHGYIPAPLWQKVIPFLNERLLLIGYEKHSNVYLRTDFSDLDRLESDILIAIDKIKNE